MADIELVIKIHEKDYQSMLNGHIPFSILYAFKHGTPLPKGHGRLIDADTYRKEMLDSREFDFFKRLDMQPTVIEADKESEDKEGENK